MKTIGEFKSLFDLLHAFPTEESCIEYLEKNFGMGLQFLRMTLLAMVCTVARILARTSTYG